MNAKMESKLPNADMQAAPRALLRAARRAREVARQTNTPIVIVRDGVLVEEWITEIDEEMAEDVARSLADPSRWP
jgi:hypothetical protein